MIYKKILILFLIILILYLLFIINKKSNNIEKFTNQNQSNNPIYLFWTGGYDSTFRLCQLVIDQKKTVIPIYITDDNLDNPTGTYKRKNREYEIEAMDKIKENIKTQFNYTKKLIKPTIYINKVNINDTIKNAMLNLYNSKKNHRPMSQYGGLAQVTFDMDKKIEIAVENDSHSTMRKMVIKDLIKKDNYYVVKEEPSDPNLKIFKNFLYPTINISKEEMLEIAKKNKYDNILSLTWSCWFPVDGKPCGNCPMCNSRIIPVSNNNKQI
jgi:7-cyano-7-deazaguanine synthase in queuosine biosynthesis